MGAPQGAVTCAVTFAVTCAVTFGNFATNPRKIFSKIRGAHPFSRRAPVFSTRAHFLSMEIYNVRIGLHRKDIHREREDATMEIVPALRKKGILALACVAMLGAALFIALPAPAWADTGNGTLSKSKTATWINEGKTEIGRAHV